MIRSSEKAHMPEKLTDDLRYSQDQDGVRIPWPGYRAANSIEDVRDTRHVQEKRHPPTTSQARDIASGGIAKHSRATRATDMLTYGLANRKY